MSKGSGGNRKSSSSKPAAMSQSKRGGMTLSQAKSKGFTDEGGGVWSLDTPFGGGQIEASGKSSVNLYRYGKEEVYHAHAWDSNYTMYADRVFYTLNEAKKYIKETLM